MSMNMLGGFFVGSTMLGGDQDASVNIVDTGGGVAHGESRVSGSLSMASLALTGTVQTQTSTTARLASVRGLTATPVNGRTSVTGNALRLSLLRGGSVVTRTSVTASTLHLARVLPKAAVSPIIGKTSVACKPFTVAHALTGRVQGATTVTGKARYGVSGDVAGRTRLTARVALLMGGLKGAIRASTRVSARPPQNAFVVVSRGKTTVQGRLQIRYALAGSVLTSTAFHSHFPGRNAHDGPLGSVNLTAVPHGDLGLPNEISGSSTLTADITIERSRLLVVLGNAGLAVQMSLVAHGTAIAGTETRYVGEPLAAPVPVTAYSALYV